MESAESIGVQKSHRNVSLLHPDFIVPLHRREVLRPAVELASDEPDAAVRSAYHESLARYRRERRCAESKTWPENGACSSTVSTMDERPWKPRRRSVNPAAIQMRVPGLRSINATNSPALYAQALNQRRPPHSPVLGPVSQYGSKQTMLPTEWSVRLAAQQCSSVRGQQRQAEASFAIGSPPIRRCSCARIATGTPGWR